jgi:hypothetical protein
MRRRIFWQLLPLDGLAGQLSGTGICITLDSWSTKQPLNLNDTDIWPEMTHTPEPHVGATDMIFCLARTEMAKIIRTAFVSKTLSGSGAEPENYQMKDKHLKQLEDEMESKYLRYCDFVNPVHQLTMAMARSGINGGRLRVRLPRAKDVGSLSEADRKELWDIANRIIDYHISVNSNLLVSRFWWHIKAFFQSDALVLVLNELRRDPGRYKDENTWTKIEQTYGNYTDLAGQKRSLHIAIGRLTIKAWDATQAWRQQNNLSIEPEPAFITAIRTRPSRKESTNPSNDPTPESAAQWQYNPFNPGDASEDLTFSYPTPNMSSGIGSAAMSANPFIGEGQVFNDFNFNEMVDPGTGTTDWLFWDQYARDPNAFNLS